MNHISEWSFTLDDAKSFIEEVKNSASDVEYKIFKHKAGEHCRFCKISGACSVQRDYFEKNVLSDFEERESAMMSNGELENVLLYLDDMEVWANSVREEAKNRALRGEEFNFFKLVAGREGNRKWENEKWIRDRLGRDAIKRGNIKSIGNRKKYSRKIKTKICGMNFPNKLHEAKLNLYWFL
jgi:hypothetical protein